VTVRKPNDFYNIGNYLELIQLISNSVKFEIGIIVDVNTPDVSGLAVPEEF
jgi:hypothetical protein